MVVIIDGRKLVIITEPQNVHLDLPKKLDKNLKHENVFIIKHNEILPAHTIKNEIRELWSKYKHENDIHEHGKK